MTEPKLQPEQLIIGPPVDSLKVTPQSTPNDTVAVSAGNTLLRDAQTLFPYTGGNSASFPALTAGQVSRWDLLVLDLTGGAPTLAIVAGIPSASPQAWEAGIPSLPEDNFPLAAIHITEISPATVVIAESDIVDVRGYFHGVVTTTAADTPQDVGLAGAVGTSRDAARSDHVHDHADLGGAAVTHHDAPQVEFTPTTAADWQTSPGDAQEALDEIGGRLGALLPLDARMEGGAGTANGVDVYLRSGTARPGGPDNNYGPYGVVNQSLGALITVQLGGGNPDGRIAAIPGDGDYIYLAVWYVRYSAGPLLNLALIQENTHGNDLNAILNTINTDLGSPGDVSHGAILGAFSVNVSGGVPTIRTFTAHNGRFIYKDDQQFFTGAVQGEVNVAGIMPRYAQAVTVSAIIAGDDNGGTGQAWVRTRQGAGGDWGDDLTGERLIQSAWLSTINSCVNEAEIPYLPDTSVDPYIYHRHNRTFSVITIYITGFHYALEY